MGRDGRADQHAIGEPEFQLSADQRASTRWMGNDLRVELQLASVAEGCGGDVEAGPGCGLWIRLEIGGGLDYAVLGELLDDSSLSVYGWNRRRVSPGSELGRSVDVQGQHVCLVR